MPGSSGHQRLDQASPAREWPGELWGWTRNPMDSMVENRKGIFISNFFEPR